MAYQGTMQEEQEGTFVLTLASIARQSPCPVPHPKLCTRTHDKEQHSASRRQNQPRHDGACSEPTFQTTLRKRAIGPDAVAL